MAAAVADFRPAAAAPRKLKKDEGTPAVALEPTEDVLGRSPRAGVPASC